jgi:ribonuclease BN (tRNA processing enzyme)
LVNGPTGDPALHIETLFEKRAVLFDLGDIAALAPNKIRRGEHVFVSHAHIDHFIGSDRLLRVLVGRDQQIRLYGTAGFINHVYHKLQAYLWSLIDREPGDLTFMVTEIGHDRATQTVRFRLKTAFAKEAGCRSNPRRHRRQRPRIPGFNSRAGTSHTGPGICNRGTSTRQYLEGPAGWGSQSALGCAT